MTDYEPQHLCGHTITAELDNGETMELWCIKVTGHPEDHSCRIYWTNAND